MSIYTVQLAQQNTGGPGHVPVYQAPPAGTVVLRDVALYLDHSTSDRVSLVMRTGSVLTVLLVVPDMPAGSSHQWQGRQVVPPGSILEVWSDVGAVHFTFTGYWLQGVVVQPVNALDVS